MNNETVLGCVITYHPDSAIYERLSSIAEQVSQLLVVDNTPTGAFNASNHLCKFQVMENKNVNGVAGALNKALQYARMNSFNYLIVFDQDSNPPHGMVDALVRTSILKNASITGPRYINSATLKPGRFMLYENHKLRSKWIGKSMGAIEALAIITSGSLLSIQKIPSTIKYDTILGIDMIDIDFNLKVRCHGGKVILDTDQIMYHGIGNREIGASRFSPPNYSWARFSLLFKNRILMWRRWKKIYPNYVLMDMTITSLDFLRTVLLIKEKKKYFLSVINGVKSGIKAEI